jgi:bifunctional N-acetylglucosamine-1-phosphate-uridyltransferase/glucosamine-1-phosphate-acetyltransferase GlmU-like protein
MNKIGAIILAGGKGKRMKMTSENKVTVTLANKPMVLHIIEFMHRINIKIIVVVVGFAKHSVIKALAKEHVIFAEQTKRLGTGHAALCALRELPDDITDVLIVYGDDAILYSEKNMPTINKLFQSHFEHQSAITFLTITLDNPIGLGRIVRDNNGKIIAIIEEKDANAEQKQIKEINPGCYMFSVSFLKKYLPLIEKSKTTGEYYLTSLVDIALKNNEVVETIQGGRLPWRGINTYEELKEAETIIEKLNG